MEFKDILGGMLYDSLKKFLSISQIDFYAHQIKKSKQWVLTSFSEQSIIDIYYLEGIAYQYWYLLAKMRAIGKNIRTIIDDLGVINEIRTEEQQFLIESFDKRNSENSSPSFGMTSNVGTFIYSKIGDVNNTIVCTTLNSMRYDISSLGFQGIKRNFYPNFIPFYINGDSFYNAHKYLEEKFVNTLNFGLLEFCQLIKILTDICLSNDKVLNIKNVSKNIKNFLFFYKIFSGDIRYFQQAALN